MAPSRTMTGETIVTEKGPQATSPTGTNNSGDTLRGDGDAIIEIHSNSSPSSRVSSYSGSSVSDAQPRDEKRPTVFRQIARTLRSEPEPLDITEINTRKLENTPNGFPRLAAFQSSEANFSLYRSFSYLHSRVLLDLQDEITTLEKELDGVDRIDLHDNPVRLMSREADEAAAVDSDRPRNRRVILRDIKAKLMEYDDVLIKARTLESFQKPSDRNYLSVRRYMHNTKPLMDSEMDSIRSKEDIVSIRSGREWANFDGQVESAIGTLDKGLKKVFRLKERPLSNMFRTPELRAKTTSKFISYYSSSRIDKLINIMITFVIFVLLVIPVIAMYHLTASPSHTDPSGPGNSTSTSNSSDTNTKATISAVGVLIVFTLLFSAAMSLFTKAARHELFAASAAYCAILVVFIGNFTGPSN